MTTTCEKCNKTFANKYTLKKHIETNTCGILIDTNCTSSKCDYKTLKKSDLQKHIKICKHVEIDMIVNNIQRDHKRELENIRLEHLIKEKYMEKERDHLVSLLEKTYTRQNNDQTYDLLIKNKNDYIATLESRLNKFDEIPKNVYEQRNSIIIEEIDEDEKAGGDDDDDDENISITLNNIVITSRPIDHYVNATQLCQAGGKKFNDWLRLDTTKELINELSPEAGIPASGLVETKRGGNDKSKQGSWIHPDLSIQLAQWISPKFAIQISKWVRTLFNKGSVEIDINLLREKERDMRIKDHRIKQLESVCLSKQRRVEYPERNVIYILTTDDHLQRRTYIIGKAKNLTSRLSTYNKTCDHTVVHHRECKNEDDMITAESLVLSKLRDYREQANRDRFILPEDKDVSFFTNAIDTCINFLT